MTLRSLPIDSTPCAMGNSRMFLERHSRFLENFLDIDVTSAFNSNLPEAFQYKEFAGLVGPLYELTVAPILLYLWDRHPLAYEHGHRRGKMVFGNTFNTCGIATYNGPKYIEKKP